ncbi:2ed82085-079b-4320-9d3d-b72f241ee540-CDS [Sclerotinia trifoliorum]|uniref:2ed82085-079b-4320-9d3d-b72f241ee540-CDS n=1 Tax=Sclerotinia trifoliorum TaxID=28548 RepID=A0A8H2ZS72_9HELO|nr:2ed82085-079b-4320-9d3d-b72f241ee540-CDS [Sclerotinia trifoliorum]
MRGNTHRLSNNELSTPTPSTQSPHRLRGIISLTSSRVRTHMGYTSRSQNFSLSSIKESIGELFPEQGIVRPDRYEEALDALEQMRHQVIKEFTTSEQKKRYG